MTEAEAEDTLKEYQRFIGKLFIRKADVLVVMVKNIQVVPCDGGYDIVFSLNDSLLKKFEESATNFLLQYKTMAAC